MARILDRLGIETETAPATDTASSGLNGRLQRIAQRLTSLIALMPASIGQKAKAASLAVALASDDDLLAKLPVPITTFKTATATSSGDTALWTPASGKKVRLMAYEIQLSANASLASAAVLHVLLRDNTTATGCGASFYVPVAEVTSTPGNFNTGWVTLGHGFLSGAVDRVLNINLSAALATGAVRVIACGAEE